jgi:uncharacterized repeat protein (TIGR02543 family)
MYVASANKIQKVTPLGVVSTYANLPANSNPKDIAIDSNGNLYTANYGSNSTTTDGTNSISKIVPDGAGGGTVYSFISFNNVGSTPAHPTAVTLDSSGNVYTVTYGTSTGNNSVRKITQVSLNSTTGTLAKTWLTTYQAYSLKFGPTGDLFISGLSASNIYKIDQAELGATGSPAVVQDDVAGAAFSIFAYKMSDWGYGIPVPRPRNMVFDAQGNLYVLTNTNIVKVVPPATSGLRGLLNTSSNFGTITSGTSIAIHPNGKIYASSSNNSSIYMYPDGLAVISTPLNQNFVAIDSSGNIVTSVATNNGDLNNMYINPPESTPTTFTISSNSETPTVGSVITGYTINRSGAIPNFYDYRVVGWSVPPALGLSFSSVTGLLSGTLTAPIPNGKIDIVITAYFWPEDREFSRTFTLYPSDPPAFTLSKSAETITAGVAYTAGSIWTINSTGGSAVYSISPAMSNPLAFQTSSGLMTTSINTAPTAAKEYTITGTNNLGSVSQKFVLTIGQYTAKEISAFTFPGQVGLSVITSTSATTGTIAITMPFESSTASLVATFTKSASATSVTVGGVNQTSASTANNFTSPVTYVVTAADGTTKSWLVTVTNALNPAKDITAFSVPGQVGTSVITSTSATTGTIAVAVESATVVTSLIATFSKSASATGIKINATSQVSATTANNFTSAVTYVVTAADGTTKSWVVTVTKLPAFTLSSTSETKSAGTAITGYLITSQGGVITSYTISPSIGNGLIFNTSTGSISGTPTVPADAVIYTIRAINAAGYSERTFTITVNPAAPAFTLSSSSEVRTVNTSATGFTIISTGGTVASYSISPSTPPGMSFSTSTGALTGTPNTVATATIYTIRATNATGFAERTFTLTVNPTSPAFTLSSTSETRTVNIVATGFTINSTGGAIASYSISPSTPPGMSFSTSTGALTGTPNTVATATTYTVRGTNAAGYVETTFVLTVNPTEPSFTLSSTSETRTVNTLATGFTIISTGGAVASYSISPYTPPGMSFSTSTGALTGTPNTAAGATIYTITATNVTGTTSRTFSLTISAASQSITFGALSNKTYGDATFSVSASASSSLTVVFTSATTGVCTISSTTVTIVSAGTCTINADQAGDSNFSAANQVGQSFSIAPRPITITAANVPISYAGSINNSVSITSGNLVSPDTLSGATYTYAGTGSTTYAASTTAPTAVGTYSITPSAATLSTGTASNYQITYAAGSLTISAASQSITFGALSNKTYGDATFSVSASASSSLTVVFTSATTGVCTISSTTVTIVSAGTCTINANQAGDSNFSAANQVVQSFNIAKASPVLGSLSNLAKTYGSSPFTLTEPTVSGAIEGVFTFTSATTSVATISSATATIVGVGTSVISALFTPTADDKYESSTVTISLTVAQRTLGQPNAPNASATAGVLKSIALTWPAVNFVSGYSAKIYTSDGITLLATVAGLSGTAKTLTAADFSSIADNTGYKIALIATGDANNADSIASALSSQITTNNSYSITYNTTNSTGGSAPGVGAYITGASATAIVGNTGSLIRTGYTFVGWNTLNNGSGSDYASDGSSSYSTTANLVLHPKWTANTLVITYNPGATDGSAITETKTADVQFNMRSNTFTKTGYTFSGWANTQNGVIVLADAAVATVLADKTYYAIWSAINYTVTYAGNGNTGGVAPTDATNYIYTDSIPIKPNSGTLIRIGYVFLGWTESADNTGTVYLPGTANATYTVGSASVNFYAKWQKVTFFVNYNSAGAIDPVPGVYTIGSSTILPANPSKAGYTFAGWFAAETGGIALTSPYSPPGSGDIWIYARWSAIAYSVTYDGNGSGGGTVPTDSNSYNIAGLVVVAGNSGSLTRSGYTFAGWKDNGAGTGNLYVAASSYTVGVVNITLYAKWTAIDYNITYNSTDSISGTVPINSASYNIGGNISVSSNSGLLRRTGYTFVGWTDNSSGTGTVYTGGNAYVVGTENINMYPKWNANTYTVTYDDNGATGLPERLSETYTSGSAAITLPGIGTLSRAAYSFQGWATSASGNAISGGYTTTIDVTLYATWTAIRYSIAYDANGGAITPIQSSLIQGQSFTLASSITKENGPLGEVYAFVGWSDGFSTFQAGYSYTVATSNIRLIAVWIRVFTVKYSLNGSSDVPPLDDPQQDGATITTAPAPTRSGYEFVGWKDQSGTLVAENATYVVRAQHYLLYAQWSAINFTITYYADGGSTTPIQSALNTGQTFTLANAISRLGYSFAGWAFGNSGEESFGAGAIITIDTQDIYFTARWAADIYAISYDLNGGIGSSIADDFFTFDESAVTLPLVGDHVRTNYTFSGWSTTLNGSPVGLTYSPSRSIVLYAVWTLNQYVLTYNGQNGAGSNPTASYTAGGTALELPLPTRTNFVFDGWHSLSTGGTLIGLAGATYIPNTTKTIYAHWTQLSLSGVASSDLTLITTSRASAVISQSTTFEIADTSVRVQIPAGALPTNTDISYYLLANSSRTATKLFGSDTYILSMVISWLSPTGEVPTTAAGKPITMVINNASIKKGSSVYSIVGSSAVFLGVATADGTVSITITEDPEIVVVKTKPGSPTNVIATNGENAASTVSWAEPDLDGGDPINSYQVTASDGQNCASTTPSCRFTNLVNGTSYTFTVKAINSIGISIASAPSSPITPIDLSQSITFSTPLDMVTGDSDQAITASSSSGLTLAITSTNTSICAIVAGKIRAISPGNCQIVAAQSGNAFYRAASSVNKLISITGNAPVAPTPQPSSFGGVPAAVLVIPGITWEPTAIFEGELVGQKQLNATFSTLGTAEYSIAIGFKPALGLITISVKFTPQDQTRYFDLTSSRTIEVIATPKINTATSQESNTATSPTLIAELAPTLAPVKVPTSTEITSLKKVGVIYFSSNEYFLDASDRKILEKVISLLKQEKYQIITVSGNTDSMEGVDNYWLSDIRSKSVSNYLTKSLKSISVNRIWNAFNNPAAIGLDTKSLALNRRVEIYVGEKLITPASNVSKTSFSKQYLPIAFNRNESYLDANDLKSITAIVRDMAKNSCMNVFLKGSQDNAKSKSYALIAANRVKAVQKLMSRLLPRLNFATEKEFISPNRIVKIRCTN